MDVEENRERRTPIDKNPNGRRRIPRIRRNSSRSTRFRELARLERVPRIRPGTLRNGSEVFRTPYTLAISSRASIMRYLITRHSSFWYNVRASDTRIAESDARNVRAYRRNGRMRPVIVISSCDLQTLFCRVKILQHFKTTAKTITRETLRVFRVENVQRSPS